jgi:hypothetical protein
MNDNKRTKHVWMVEDVPARDGREARSFWTRIGTAFENRDGSLSVELSAFPTSGKLVIRDAKPKEGE